MLVTSGCAERITITTRPPGADVYVNGRLIGKSPVEYSVPSRKWTGHYTYRLEKEGYEPRQGVLDTSVSGGRVTGGVLTLGMSLAFKRPETFAEGEYVFDLYPIDTGEEQVSRRSSVEQRLRKIEQLRDRGVIGDDEYEESRKTILKDL